MLSAPRTMAPNVVASIWVCRASFGVWPPTRSGLQLDPPAVVPAEGEVPEAASPSKRTGARFPSPT